MPHHYTIYHFFLISNKFNLEYQIVSDSVSSEIEQKSIALIDHFPRRDMLSTTSYVTFCIKNLDLARPWYFSYQIQYGLWCLHTCVVKKFIWRLYHIRYCYVVFNKFWLTNFEFSTNLTGIWAIHNLLLNKLWIYIPFDCISTL